MKALIIEALKKNSPEFVRGLVVSRLVACPEIMPWIGVNAEDDQDWFLWDADMVGLTATTIIVRGTTGPCGSDWSITAEYDLATGKLIKVHNMNGERATLSLPEVVTQLNQSVFMDICEGNSFGEVDERTRKLFTYVS